MKKIICCLMCIAFVLILGCDNEKGTITMEIHPTIHIVGLESETPKVMFEYKLGSVTIVDAIEKITGADAFYLAQLKEHESVTLEWTIGTEMYNHRVPNYKVGVNEYVGSTRMKVDILWKMRNDIPIKWSCLGGKEYKNGATEEEVEEYARKLAEKENGENVTESIEDKVDEPTPTPKIDPFEGTKL